MSRAVLDWMEFAFNVFYLVVVFGTAGMMALRLAHVPAPERPVARRMLWAVALLGTGDLGHIGLRVISQLTGGRFAAWIGWGGLTTAITVTLFYVLLLDAWRLRFGRPLGALGWTLVATAVVRLALLAAPGNDWAAPIPPLGWSLLRNAPLVALGLGVMALYLRDGLDRLDGVFFRIGVLIAVSFACYAPVILFVQQEPRVALFMIPKTLAYLAMGIAAYRALFRPHTQPAPAP